jgi:hypothetical protein
MGADVDNFLYPGDEVYDGDFDDELMQAVTCEQLMTEGRHYWEVEFTHKADFAGVVRFGAIRPGQDCEDTAEVPASSNTHFGIVSCRSVAQVQLFGNGKSYDADQEGCDGDVSHVDKGVGFCFKQGDRIGCLLDLDAGWLRFFRNGVRLRQGYASGVTGPLLRSVQVQDEGAVLTALPGAETPAGE